MNPMRMPSRGRGAAAGEKPPRTRREAPRGAHEERACRQARERCGPVEALWKSHRNPAEIPQKSCRDPTEILQKYYRHPTEILWKSYRHLTEIQKKAIQIQ